MKTKDTSMPQILAADFFTIIESEKAKTKDTLKRTIKPQNLLFSNNLINRECLSSIFGLIFN